MRLLQEFIMQLKSHGAAPKRNIRYYKSSLCLVTSVDCLDQSSKKLNKRSAWLGLVVCKLNFSILLFLSWSCPSLKCKWKNASSVCFYYLFAVSTIRLQFLC